MARPPPPPLASEKISTLFHVGAHVLCVSRVMEGRWTCTVDEAPVASSYQSQAEAWEAGVREADRLDRAAAAG